MSHAEIAEECDKFRIEEGQDKKEGLKLLAQAVKATEVNNGFIDILTDSGLSLDCGPLYQQNYSYEKFIKYCSYMGWKLPE